MNKNSYIFLIITLGGLGTTITPRTLAQPTCYMIDANGNTVNLSSICQPRTKVTSTPVVNNPTPPPTNQGDTNPNPPTTNQTNNNGGTNQLLNPFDNGIQGVTGTENFSQPSTSPSRFQRRLPFFFNQPN